MMMRVQNVLKYLSVFKNIGKKNSSNKNNCDKKTRKCFAMNT